MPPSDEDVLEVIASEAGLDPARITSDATMLELDIGSLDVASIVFELEDRFGVEIEPEKVSPDWTIGQFVAHVRSLAPE